MDGQEMNKAVETEALEVNGHAVDVIVDGGNLTVKLPEGLSDEAKAELRMQLETGQVGKLIAAWNKKNFDINREREELAKLRAEIEAQNVATTTPAETKAGDSEGIPEVWEMLGLNSEDELTEYVIDNPVEFYQAIEKRATQAAEAKAEVKLRESEARQRIGMEQQMLEAEIRKEGYDPIQVQAFARLYEMPYGAKAWQLYRSQYQDRSNPVYAAQVEAQKKQINYVEQSNFRFKGKLSDAELSGMSDEQLDAYSKYLLERVSQE